MAYLAVPRPAPEVFFASTDARLNRQLQRRVAAGELCRIASGVHLLAGTDADISACVQRNWQVLAAHFAPGAVVSHISAFARGLTEGGYVTLSHPTLFNKTIKLPGLTLILLRGPGPLAGDLALGTTGLHWASRPRMLLENLGRVRRVRPTRAGRAAVEERLVGVLNASGERGLNQIRDAARQLVSQLPSPDAWQQLDQIIGLLLSTRQEGKLHTRAGRLVARGTPVDAERMARFELLAAALRTTVLPVLPDVAPRGEAKLHFAFVESYFSNFVEGTRFSIEEAEGIVLRNAMVTGRPKDSHDVLGVFNLAMNAGTRDSVPAPDAAFVAGLQERHRLMLERRPEAHPGELKTTANFAGMTEFVPPGFVRGTLQEGSRLALSIPEGLPRAIFYAFLVSEVHPFDDGNGRLSRLMMNAELSRLGLCRVIIPTLFHPQYVDCQRALTRSDNPDGFIKALACSASWCAGFEYADLPALIDALKRNNAFEESPVEFRLLDAPPGRAVDRPPR